MFLEKDIESGNKLLLVLGRAGTGKSTLLRKLCDETKKKYVVVAPTGIAAVNVGGQTIHSFFKFKPGVIYEEAKKYGERSTNDMYKKLELLVIDEISMVRADLLDCVDIFLKKARRNDAPFGGVQVVMFGDLYQLEPIVSKDEKEMLFSRYDSAYFFSSWVFNEMFLYPKQLIEYVELKHVFRQKDIEFINLLDKIRKKEVEEYDLYKINKQYQEVVPETNDEYIYLTTRNDSADRINVTNLNIIPEDEHTFTGILEGNFPEKVVPTPIEVKLKVGARVMLLNNDVDKRWFNGTLGAVTKIEKEAVFIKLDNGPEYAVTQHVWSYYKYTYDKEKQKIRKDIIGSYTQFPIKLAWAITIHKSQGQTFDKAIIWLEGRTFARGQLYVALSRCRTLEGIILSREIQEWDIIEHEQVKVFMKKIEEYINRWGVDGKGNDEIIAQQLIRNQTLVTNE